MFGFRKPITHGRFVFAALVRIGLLVAVTLAFPYFVFLMVNISGARNTGGAGGALAVVMGLYLKPIIYLLFCAFMLRPSARRAATVGMTPMIGLAVALAILGDIGFGTVFGAHWGVGFSLGVFKLAAPWQLLSALVAVVTLGVLRDRFDDRGPSERWGVAYGVWLTLLGAVAFFAVMTVLPVILFLAMGKGAGPLVLGLFKVVAPVRAVLSPMLLAFLFTAASVWLLIVDRMAPSSGTTPTRLPVAPPPPSGRVASFGRRAA